MSDILNQLFAVLEKRKGAAPDSSYVASLYDRGTAHISDKILEEAQEAVDEALQGDAERFSEESADLLFHLMVLWADQGLKPDDIYAVLEGRFGTSGHDEKASRDKN